MSRRVCKENPLLIVKDGAIGLAHGAEKMFITPLHAKMMLFEPENIEKVVNNLETARLRIIRNLYKCEGARKTSNPLRTVRNASHVEIMKAGGLRYKNFTCFTIPEDWVKGVENPYQDGSVALNYIDMINSLTAEGAENDFNIEKQATGFEGDNTINFDGEMYYVHFTSRDPNPRFVVGFLFGRYKTTLFIGPLEKDYNRRQILQMLPPE